MKYITLLLLFFGLSQFNLQAQISTEELPVSFGVPDSIFSERMVKKVFSGTKILPPIDTAALHQEDIQDTENGIPPRFGYPHQVNYTLENSGKWFALPNGDKIWKLDISCPNALSINLLYDKFWLPDSAKLFVYSKNKTRVIGAFTSQNNKGTKENLKGFATELIYSNEITLEYYVPNNVQEQGIISIAHVVQGYKYMNVEGVTKAVFGSSGPCMVNINCPEGQNWQNEKNAIVLILIDGYRCCTGALINTTANDNQPLLLTADHCLKVLETIFYDAYDNPDLSNWSFYWHYESPDCSNSSDPPQKVTVGARVIANHPASDFALLRLAEDPKNKASVTPYYLGWDRSGNPGTGGVGIHHPNGDVKKISTYTMPPISTNSEQYSAYIYGNCWRVVWSLTATNYGVTAKCSSGSPLLNSNHHIIGQLYKGKSSCDNLSESDWYGKFDWSWDRQDHSIRRLKDWLDPGNTGVLTLDGIGLCMPEYTNKVVTTPVNIKACENILIKNVKVQGSNAKFTIDAPGDVIINSDFEVETNAQFEIK